MAEILINNFTKVNESVFPDKLTSNELTVLTNMRLDEQIGVASTRKGFTRYSAQVDTTGTINSIFDVIDANGDNYLLTGMNTALKISDDDGDTWADLKTGLTTDQKIRMAPFGGKFLFTNGIDNPFYSDMTNTYDLTIAKPDITSISYTNNNLGTLPTNGVRIDIYMLVYQTADGQRSNPSNKFAFISVYADDTINLTLSNIPISADSRVISKKLFRSKNGNYTRFYLVATLDNSETTYTDYISDDSLNTSETIEYLNVPLSSEFISSDNSRIFLANNTKLASNRVIAPVMWNQGITYVFDDTTAGSMGAGTYHYRYSYVDKDGNESESVSFFDYTLGASSKRLDFYITNQMLAFQTFIDWTDESTYTYNTSIKYLRIYRTKAGGTTYYHLTDYELPLDFPKATPGSGFFSDLFYGLGTTVYATYDSVNDSALTVEYPVSSHNATEVLSLKSSVIFSNLDKFSEFPELNYWDIYPDDGNEITGIFEDDLGQIIFKTNSICKLWTKGTPVNWSVEKLTENIGCDQPNTIIKFERNYFFVYRNIPYVFNAQSSPKILGDNGYGGFNLSTTFNSITSYLGSAFWVKNRWYMLTVKISTNYYVLAFDTKLGGWYKFSIHKADTIFNKNYGTNKDKILLGGADYIMYYNETATQDGDTTDELDAAILTDISVELKTKDFSLVESFKTARLMMFYTDYIRKTGITNGFVIFYINGTSAPEVTSYNKYYIDVDDTQTEGIYKMPTDSMFGNLQRAYRVNFQITGKAITKFIGSKIDNLWDIKYPLIDKKTGRISSKIEYDIEDDQIPTKEIDPSLVLDSGKWFI